MLYRLSSLTLVTLLLGVPLLGCGGPPRANARLAEAQQAYQTAAQDSVIVNLAPVALAEAREALNRAENVWRQKDETVEVDHHSYLALQRIRIAEELARLNAAEREVQQAQAERQQVLLEARVAEAEAAQAQAEAERLAAEQARQEAEQALARASQLAEQVNELEAELTRRGLVLTLGDVLFDVGRATLKPGAERTVNALVQFLNQYPERNVLIEGFTDTTGSRELNLRLSQQRADAVRSALIERGIPGTRIQTRGYGPDYPVASNDTAAGRQQNRRVEIVISDPQGNIPARN